MARLRRPPAKVNPQRLQQRHTSAAQMFTPLSATHGFRYVYFPARAQMPIGQVRKYLRQLGTANITPIPDFDPLDPVHLKDPTYDDLSEDEQARSPVKYDVAKSFADEGWISAEEMKNLLNKNNAHANNLFHHSGSNHSMSFGDATISVSTMSAIGHDFKQEP
ncbi:hypothetical protein EC973_008912 [Apophysomyces ossiformis]|uniref:Uncharacterized protein n=1 Tax=Apophysomyces ossiformis TaxID=679940 RepID=A0A8H7EQP9_9FUNG|nr:hypothetical protein EC973_008912 [Apophysomyces ossiformis]